MKVASASNLVLQSLLLLGLVAVERDIIEFHFIFKKSFAKNSILVISRFHVAFFINKSHINACRDGKTHMKLNIGNIKFYTELDFHNIKFQKSVIFLDSLKIILFY